MNFSYSNAKKVHNNQSFLSLNIELGKLKNNLYIISSSIITSFVDILRHNSNQDKIFIHENFHTFPPYFKLSITILKTSFSSIYPSIVKPSLKKSEFLHPNFPIQSLHSLTFVVNIPFPRIKRTVRGSRVTAGRLAIPRFVSS